MAEILNKRKVHSRTYDLGNDTRETHFRKGQCYFDDDTQQYELVDAVHGDIPKKRGLDYRTFSEEEGVFKVLWRAGTSYEDEAGDFQICEPDIVVGSNENGFDFSVEKIRIPVHISADGNRRHKPDRSDTGKSFDIDKPVLPGLGSPVVDGNKITWSRPDWYDYSVIVMPEGSKVEVTFWQEPPEKSLTFNTSRSGMTPQEADVFMLHPPTARDANKNNVPLDWDKKNNKITVTMDDTGATYPIVVDPEFSPLHDFDTYIEADSPTTPNGTSNPLLVSKDTAPGPKRTLLKFSEMYSWVPQGQTITTATLSLFCQARSPLSTAYWIDCCRITRSDHTTNGATWNTYDGVNAWTTPGGDYTETGKTYSIQGGNGVFMHWPITGLANDAMTDRAGLLALLLMWEGDESGNWETEFTSSEDSTIADRPLLEFIYTADQQYQPMTKDTFLSAKSKTSEYGDEEFVYAGTHSLDGYRPIINLDMTGEFDGSEIIDGASYQMYCYNTSGGYPEAVTGPARAKRLTQTGWVELEATWNVYSTGNNWSTAGGDYTDVDQGAETWPVDKFSWLGLECTDLVQDAISNRSQILNMIIIHTEDGGADYGHFRSSDYTGGATYRPELVINWSVGGPAFQLLAGVTDGLSTTSIPQLELLMAFVGSSTGLSTASLPQFELSMKFDGSSAGVATVADIPNLIKEIALLGSSAGASTCGDPPFLKVIRELGGAADGVATSGGIPLGALMVFDGAANGAATVSDIPVLKASFALPAGASDGSSTAGAILTATIEFTGASNGVAVVSDIPALKVSFDLPTGASDGLSTAGATLKASFDLSTMASDGLSTSGALINLLMALACASDGLSTVGAPLKASFDLPAGASDGLSTTAATITIAKVLVGVSDGTSNVSDIPDLKVTREVSGITAGVATAGAFVKATKPLEASSDGGATTNASINVTIELAGASAGLSTTAAILDTIRELGAASAGSSTAEATIQTTADILLVGQSNGLSTASAATKITKPFIGTSDGVATVTANLKLTMELAGQAVGLSTAGAVIESATEFVGAANGSSTAGAVLELAGAVVTLVGQADGTSTSGAAAKSTRTLDGQADGVATTSAAIKLTMKLIASSAGNSTAGAILESVSNLTGITNGSSTVAASLSLSSTLSGASSGVSTCGAVLESVTELLGASSGLSTAGASLEVSVGFTELVGSSAGGSTAGAIIKKTVPFVGASDGLAATQAGIITVLILLGSTNGTSVVQGRLPVLRSISGASNGLSSVQANVDVFIWLLGQTAGVSTVTCGIVEIPYRQRGAVSSDEIVQSGRLDKILKGIITVIKRPL